jgi:hypothetical protein
MVPRIFALLGVGLLAATLALQERTARAEHPSGSWSAPPCGKVCRLVCEKKKIPGIGYGSKCETICIPGPSRQGCKNCDTTCCAGDDIKGCRPKIEFSWYDYFACGCAQPREIRLLTKYQAEKEVPSYHWEVVDAACCDCVTLDGSPSKDGNIYKAAPTDAALGDVLVVSDEEWTQISPKLNPTQAVTPVEYAQAAPAPAAPSPTLPEDAEKTSVAERLQSIFQR